MTYYAACRKCGQRVMHADIDSKPLSSHRNSKKCRDNAMLKISLRYEPIRGDRTLFRQEDGQLVHLSEKEQEELGLPSRADEPSRRKKAKK